MARTRTLVPVSAAHESTASAEHSHAERALYAGLRWAAFAAALLMPAGLRGEIRSAAAPCAQCVRFSVSAAEALALPRRLEGLSVMLRVRPGAAATDWEPAVQDLRERGATVGLHIVGIPD